MDYNFLADTVLFHGASPEEIKSMLGCLGAVEKTAAKGEVLFRAGSPAKYMAMVLSGSVQIENDDVWGNKSVLDSIGPGEVFAETYACVPDEPLQVSAVAVEKSALLLMDAARLLRTCPQACAHHVTLIRNLLVVSAQKNLSCPAASSTPRPRPSGDGCCPISPIRPCAAAGTISIFPSTGSSWRTISA